MSVTLTTTEQISRSPVNRSTAKQLFSFSRGPRFQPPRKLNGCDRYYDLPSTRLRRTTSFGYGSRDNMARRDVSPPPTTYTLPTDFQFQHKGRMFSFGTCREACAKVSAKGELGQDRAIPGPGTYEVREVPGKDARKFSFRPRTTNPMHMLYSSRAPGPGTYDVLASISPKGPQFYSKFESSRAAIFNPPRSKRFQDLPKEVLAKPGPGHYPVYSTISKTGVYFLSNLKSSMCRTFGARPVDTSSTASFHYMSQTPGPGSYPVPSEFGIYQAQEKYIREYQRTEDKRKVGLTACTSRTERRDQSVQPTRRSAPVRFSSTGRKARAAREMKHDASESTFNREQDPRNKTSAV